ncbi:astacin [Necator americanus]|uniref:Metalloendopeptidase n=1 Tax=Necator americanus TaxID=51031 RepID=W2SFS3_NECAM|nr:astacin [Necator americanus]ETN68440.1 astacin [Necator americanus]
MKKIDENTCIRFKPRKSSEEDYVDIQNNLAEGCMQLDSVIHELLHVLGLWHEHMRADRDEHIKVHQKNIQLGFKNQFAKMMAPDAATYGVPYDYLSIMHYPKDANAVPGTITIETLDPKYQVKKY